ncbi:MAG: acetylornithine/succinylornithine family transaminase, partial [Cyclobacteriaceae bacterium]|nr:acetylornithine/succinylornithine family transaminase [Cyclobacteriaceae bacterium]
MKNIDLHTKDQQYYLPTFKRIPLTFVKGKGSKLWDIENKEYTDMLAGIAVNNVGHCHPKVVEAIQDQAAELMHISNFFVSPAQVALSELLVKISGMDRIFFTNSGAESVEGAIKIARRYAHSKGRGGKIISMENSFHGRTLATIATGQPKYQEGFGPMPSGFIQVPFNDLEALKKEVNQDVAAIILEPIQGEGGIIPAEKPYLQAVKQLCEEEDIVLIFDEIQSGIGRTGYWFAKDLYGVQPDIMTLAKGLGGGMPIGAFLCNEKIAGSIQYGDHGTTFGGNPMATAASLATLKVIVEE